MAGAQLLPLRIPQRQRHQLTGANSDGAVLIITADGDCYALEFEQDMSSTVTGLKLTSLNCSVAKPSSVVSVDDSTFFCGSTTGDSLLVDVMWLSNGKSSKDSHSNMMDLDDDDIFGPGFTNGTSATHTSAQSTSTAHGESPLFSSGSQSKQDLFPVLTLADVLRSMTPIIDMAEAPAFISESVALSDGVSIDEETLASMTRAEREAEHLKRRRVMLDSNPGLAVAYGAGKLGSLAIVTRHVRPVVRGSVDIAGIERVWTSTLTLQGYHPTVKNVFIVVSAKDSTRILRHKAGATDSFIELEADGALEQIVDIRPLREDMSDSVVACALFSHPSLVSYGSKKNISTSQHAKQSEGGNTKSMTGTMATSESQLETVDETAADETRALMTMLLDEDSDDVENGMVDGGMAGGGGGGSSSLAQGHWCLCVHKCGTLQIISLPSGRTVFISRSFGDLPSVVVTQSTQSSQPTQSTSSTANGGDSAMDIENSTPSAQNGLQLPQIVQVSLSAFGVAMEYLRCIESCSHRVVPLDWFVVHLMLV
ncbi:hypothetical protein GQ42DRAFT_158136 [Ramicandelaber brevisporus]|nr:hypothetical protein GQ42DRAFT_158136 [Ramicandelaber brevisporus]